MKKFSLIFILTMMVFVTGCGENKASNVGVESDEETGVLEENVSIVEAQEGAIAFPEIEYEEWLCNSTGEILFGYNVPLGWTMQEGSKNQNRVSVSIMPDSSKKDDVSIICSRENGEDLVTWYDTEIAPQIFTDSGEVYSLVESFDTVYGICKLFYGDDDRENYADDVSALIKLNNEWCVWITCADIDENPEVRCDFLKNVLFMIIGDKETENVIDYEYPNYLTDDNGNEIMGFNTPIGMDRKEATMVINGVEESLEGVYFTGKNCEMSIQNATFRWISGIESGEYATNYYEWKNEMDTVYGKASLYEMSYSNGVDDKLFYCDVAVIEANGKNVVITYTKSGAEGYTGELEEIITNQLFVQE